MAPEPHLRRSVNTISEWLSPPWRRRRDPERRAIAWAATGLSLASYLFVVLTFAGTFGPGVAALYAIPCLVAGWAFGASGGLAIALLGFPLHAWLVPGSFPSAFAATAVAVSVGAARDLRERLRERGHELAESEDRYRQLVDNNPEGVLVHERGVVVFANASLARMAGVPDPHALIGRTVVTLAPFEDREALALLFVFAAEMRAPRSIEARLAKPGGETVDVVMTTMPIHYRGARSNLVLVREAALIRAPAKLSVKADPPTGLLAPAR